MSKSYEDEIKKLSKVQYNVTMKNGTEPPFQNEYHDEFREGIYVDIVSKEVLFSSNDKFDAGCGWPSFTAPVNKDLIVEKKDHSHFMTRTEVRSKNPNIHLGHVFDDGPNGQPRYCINSASLAFIPKEDMKKAGYEEYLSLFKK